MGHVGLGLAADVRRGYARGSAEYGLCPVGLSLGFIGEGRTRA